MKNLSLRRNDGHRLSKRHKKYRRLNESMIDVIAAAYIAGEPVADIAERLGISHSTIPEAAKRRGIPLRHRLARTRCVHIEYDVEEREDRMHGYAARDLTGTLMGDPPVGFSALDRRG